MIAIRSATVTALALGAVLLGGASASAAPDPFQPGPDYTNFQPGPDYGPFEPGANPGTADLVDDTLGPLVGRLLGGLRL